MHRVSKGSSSGGENITGETFVFCLGVARSQEIVKWTRDFEQWAYARVRSHTSAMRLIKLHFMNPSATHTCRSNLPDPLSIFEGLEFRFATLVGCICIIVSDWSPLNSG